MTKGFTAFDFWFIGQASLSNYDDRFVPALIHSRAGCGVRHVFYAAGDQMGFRKSQ